MANVKISALPQVTSVSGSDIIPAVASSATSKITITDLANSLPQVSSSISASFATTASHALNVTSINTGSFITTGSNSTTQKISGSLNLTGSLNHIGSVNVTGNIIGDYTIGTNVLATTDFKNFNFANAFQKAAFPYIFSDIITAQFGAGSYTFNLQPTYIGHSVLRIDGNQPAPAIKLVYDASGTTVNVSGRGTIPYYTIISDNNSLLNNSSNVNFVSNNGRKHSLTVTGSILSKDGVSLGTDISNKHYITGSIISTGSFTHIGDFSASGSLFGTSSWAVSASWAPSAGGSGPIAVTGSTLYSTDPASAVPSGNRTENGIFFGSGSGFGSNSKNAVFLGLNSGYSASNAGHSVFIGSNAGYLATKSTSSVFIGNEAGYSASRKDGSAESVFIGYKSGHSSDNIYSVFIGSEPGRNDTTWAGWGNNFIGLLAGAYNSLDNGSGTEFTNAIGWLAGYSASYSSYSNFFGYNAGREATNAFSSNFIGGASGQGAVLSSYSNFIGYQAGIDAVSASYSNLFGFRAGEKVTGAGLGRNNIIIGTSITLENDRKDSINIGGLIFGTGSYFNSSFSSAALSSGSANGRIGINIVNPTQALDVSGSVQISQVLVLPPQHPLPSGMPTGSIASSGSDAECKPYFWNGATWTSLI